MSSGFMLAKDLAEFLRKPYQKGDLDVTVQYLVESLPIGEYRVMLKRNFDTACWVPPVGSRGSHSIYYGDRMLSRVIDFYCKQQELEGVPTLKDLAEKVKLRKEAARAAAATKAGKPVPTAPVTVGPTEVMNEKLEWVKRSVTPVMWEEFLAMLVKAVSAYGRHERQHARHTTRDLKQVNRDLKMLSIPFHYFNLFEDARIEHISRDSELGTRFDWISFEDLAPIKAPDALFLRCIQLEGDRDDEALDSEDPYGDGSRTLGHVADSVEGYYKRACACTTSEQLYPIIKEFLDEFKEDLKDPPEDGEDGGEGGAGGSGGSGSGSSSGSSGTKGKGKGSGPGSSGKDEDEDGTGGSGEEEHSAEERAGDLSTAAEAADLGDKFFEEFEADAEVVGGTDEEGKKAEERAKEKLRGDSSAEAPKGKGSKTQGIPLSLKPEASGGRAQEKDFLSSHPGKVDAVYAKRVEDLTNMLMRMFKSHNLPAATESPGRRLSTRHLARGEVMYIHKKVFGGKGKRKYSIVYDCSGSMGGQPDREGKLLLLALNNLAKRGFLEGSLILSGYVDGRPGWLQYSFPVAESVILRISPSHCSEGIQDALKDNLKHIKGMDDVYVYTDANICDAPLNRAYFAKQRIWPVGLYAGDDDAASEMEEHFPQNIIRKTIEQVVEAMLTRNRRTVG